MKEEVFALSPYATVRWDASEVCVGSLLRGERLASPDAILLVVMHAFARPRTIREVVELAPYDASDVEEVARELIEAGVLVSNSPSCFWDPADLDFHLASTQVAGPVKSSGVNAFPAVRPRHQGASLALPRSLAASTGTVAGALRARRSVRRFAGGPIPLTVLAELLEQAAGDRGGDHALTVRRPYPSGGATYSLELYLAVPGGAVQDLAGGVYHYHSADHQLEALSGAETVEPFVVSAEEMKGHARAEGEGPPIVILVTSRLGRARAWYSSIAYRLVLLEVGALIQSIYLASHALGLGACALGDVCGGGALTALAELDPLEEPLVASLVVGAPLPSSTG